MRAVRRSGRRKMDKIEKGLHSKTKQKQKREKEKRKVPRGEWRLYTLHFCTLQKKQSSTCYNYNSYKLNILHNNILYRSATTVHDGAIILQHSSIHSINKQQAWSMVEWFQRRLVVGSGGVPSSRRRPILLAISSN